MSEPVAAGLVVVDKPTGMTSHDVVVRCRRIFATRRVGHAGTLEPMAHTLGELAETPRLSYSLDEACLRTFARRDLSTEESVAAGHGRPLPASGLDGIHAATDPAGRVITLLRDTGERTQSVVVVRPATLWRRRASSCAMAGRSAAIPVLDNRPITDR